MKIIDKLKKAFEKQPVSTTKIVRLDSVESTNGYLRTYKPEENEPMTVVMADYQTAGRGQGTNKWESEAGKNLLFSVLLHPDRKSVV